MAMKFYMTPGSCSTGIHILLETLELPFEAWILSLPAGDHLKPEYLAINPRGTIPTLVPDDGLALTDFRSTLPWASCTVRASAESSLPSATSPSRMCGRARRPWNSRMPSSIAAQLFKLAQCRHPLRQSPQGCVANRPIVGGEGSSGVNALS